MSILAENNSYSQSEKEIIWKKYTSDYYNITLEIPSNWMLTEETSRFDDVKNVYVSNQGTTDFPDGVMAIIGISNTTMLDGPEVSMKNELEAITSVPEDDSQARIIEGIQHNKYNISNSDSFSILYKESDSVFDTAKEKVAFTHNSTDYIFDIMITPPNFYDNPAFTEIRERVINSIVFHPQGSTE